MTDPAGRRVLTELYAAQDWAADLRFLAVSRDVGRTTRAVLLLRGHGNQQSRRRSRPCRRTRTRVGWRRLRHQTLRSGKDTSDPGERWVERGA